MNIRSRKLIVSLIAGILMLGVSMLRVQLDDTLEMRVDYWFLQGIEQECHLVIDYGDDSYDISPHLPADDTYFANGWLEIIYEIPKDHRKPQSFSIQLAHDEDTAQVRCIEFYHHNLQVAKYSPADIGFLFESNGDRVNINKDRINITGQEEVILSGTEDFLRLYQGFSEDDTGAYYNCIGLAVFVAVLCYYILFAVEKRKRKDMSNIRLEKADIVLAIGLAIIFAVCCAMSFGSKHYAHADEYVTRYAIDYYLGKWLPPTSFSHWQAGTHSIYGMSRLNEATLYYFFAGKVGWVCKEFLHIQTYYRALGLILLSIMLWTCWRYRSQRKWLALALCITPQIWYTFSYATSDHWDWFWGFWIIVVTLDKNSILYRAIEGRGTLWKICLNTLLCALLFAQMFLGKSNYLIVLAVPFFELVFYWFSRGKRELRVLLHYFVIFALTLGIYKGIGSIPRVGNAYSVDLPTEEVQKTLEDREVSGDDAEFSYYTRPAPAESGLTFWDMLWHYSYMPAPALLFTSAIGYYVWQSLWGGKIYCMIMLMLYFVIGIGFLVSIIKEKDWIAKSKIIISGFLMAALFGVTLLYCYYVTFQPQGRYILAVFLILAYAGAYAERFIHSRIYNWLVAACCMASLWCFCYTGLFTMYQNGFMLL